MNRALAASGLVAACAAIAAGCGWIIGVSNDVQVVDVSDAQDEPTFLACGAATCALTRELCCYAPAGGTCVDRADASCAGGELAMCDDPSDCDGSACCVEAIRPFGVRTRCKAACAPGEARACSTSQDCTAGDCTPWACGGSTVRTCGGEGADAGCIP